MPKLKEFLIVADLFDLLEPKSGYLKQQLLNIDFIQICRAHLSQGTLIVLISSKILETKAIVTLLLFCTDLLQSMFIRCQGTLVSLNRGKIWITIYTYLTL